MAIKMVIGKSCQVLRSGRACIIQHFACRQMNTSGNGQLITEKVGRSLVSLQDRPWVLPEQVILGDV